MGAYAVLSKIIRNDAIKLDPPEVYNWRVFAVAAAVRQQSPEKFVETDENL